MQNARIFPAKPVTNHIRLDFETNKQTYWAQINASASQLARPCCTAELIDDALKIQTHIRHVQAVNACSDAEDVLTHLVVASDAPGVFSLGGDLALFMQAIRSQDRESLEAYALRCVDVVHGFQSLADGTTHTIALIQGSALGGGLELALACDTIVAEAGSLMAFPEIMFGLFPGMGAYPFLCKRISPLAAKRMMLDRRTYTAAEMKAMGIVDILTERGAGFEATEQLIDKQRRAGAPNIAVSRIHNAHHNVALETLQAIARAWVSCALRLPAKQIGNMERLLSAQWNRSAPSAEVVRAVR